eukprot:5913973-Amphidinium_carterae.2
MERKLGAGRHVDNDFCFDYQQLKFWRCGKVLTGAVLALRIHLRTRVGYDIRYVLSAMNAKTALFQRQSQGAVWHWASCFGTCPVYPWEKSFSTVSRSSSARTCDDWHQSSLNTGWNVFFALAVLLGCRRKGCEQDYPCERATSCFFRWKRHATGGGQ